MSRCKGTNLNYNYVSKYTNDQRKKKGINDLKQKMQTKSNKKDNTNPSNHESFKHDFALQSDDFFNVYRQQPAFLADGSRMTSHNFYVLLHRDRALRP